MRVAYDTVSVELGLPNLLPGLEDDPVGREKGLALQAAEVAAGKPDPAVGPVRWIVPVGAETDRGWLERLGRVLAVSSDPNFEVIFWADSMVEFPEVGRAVRSSRARCLGEIELDRANGWIGTLPDGVIPQPEAVAVIRRYVDENTSVHADFAACRNGGGVNPDPDTYSFYGYNSFGAVYLTAGRNWGSVTEILGGLLQTEAAIGDVGRLQGAATIGKKMRIPLRLFVVKEPLADGCNPHWKGILDRVARRDLGGRFLEERPRVGWDGMELPKVGVVIPFRDQAALTSGTLRSLGGQRGGWIQKVVLVDNGSNVEEAGRVRRVANETFGEGRVVWVEDGGPFNFARLNNRGAEAAEGCDLYWFCNNDIEIDDRSALGELCGLLALPEIGMAGGALYYPDGTLQSAGIFDGPMGPQVARDAVTERATAFREVTALTFASVLVRREAWEAVGGLDEDVCPNGFGDALFGKRLREKGWRILVDPAIHVRHFESPSRGKRPEAIERWELSRAGISIRAFQDSFLNGAQPFLWTQMDRKPPSLGKRLYRTLRAAAAAWKKNRN